MEIAFKNHGNTSSRATKTAITALQKNLKPTKHLALKNTALSERF